MYEWRLFSTKGNHRDKTIKEKILAILEEKSRLFDLKLGAVRQFYQSEKISDQPNFKLIKKGIKRARIIKIKLKIVEKLIKIIY